MIMASPLSFVIVGGSLAGAKAALDNKNSAQGQALTIVLNAALGGVTASQQPTKEELDRVASVIADLAAGGV